MLLETVFKIGSSVSSTGSTDDNNTHTAPIYSIGAEKAYTSYTPDGNEPIERDKPVYGYANGKHGTVYSKGQTVKYEKETGTIFKVTPECILFAVPIRGKPWETKPVRVDAAEFSKVKILGKKSNGMIDETVQEDV